MKVFRIILPVLFIVFLSCKATVENLFSVTAQNFATTIAENPTLGQTMGSVTASGVGVFAFSISTQNPTGAILINPLTGEITVADPTLFDYETRQSITGTYTVTSGAASDQASITITITDDPTD